MTAPERAPILLPLRVSRREVTAVLLFAAAMATLFVLPYLLGHWLVRPGRVFTGLWFNLEDATYLTAIAQGRHGSWLYRNLFTTEAHAPVFIEVFYLALGHLARLLRLETVTAWHLGRWLAAFVLFLVVYLFVASFLRRVRLRWTALLLAVLGAGFDWARLPAFLERAVGMDAVPIDRFMPEAHLFFSALTYPHFTAGITFILLFFLFLLRALGATGRMRFWFVLGAGLSNVALVLIYPFLIYLIAAVTGAFFLTLCWQARRLLWRTGLLMVLAGLFPAPLFAYYAVVLLDNDVFRVWSAQAATLSPSPLHYLLTYAPYLLLGALALRVLRRWPWHERRRFDFLLVWLVVVPLLLYAPVNPQRRFVEGVQVPLAILAAVGLYDVVLPWLLARRPLRALLARPRYSAAGLERLLILLTVALVSLASLYTYLGALYTLVVLQPYPLARPVPEVEAMAWLRVHGDDDAAVLTDYETGSYLPSQTGKRVFVGHRYETVDFAAKREAAARFLAGGDDATARRQLLQTFDISYLFVTARGPGEPASACQDSFLEQAFANEAVTICRVAGNKK